MFHPWLIPILLLLLSFYFVTSNENHDKLYSVQKSEGEMYAGKMLSYMNLAADPCEDFYEYACGNYFKVNRLKPAAKAYSVVEIVSDELSEDMHNVLMEPTKEKFSSVNKAKYFYQSCIKEKIFEFPKSKAYLRFFESLGGWPALNSSWNAGKFDWVNATIALARYGVETFIRVEGSNISEGEFGLKAFTKENINRPLSRTYHINKELIKIILAIYGVPPKAAAKIFKEIINFGRKWMQIASRTKFLYEDRVAMSYQKLKAESPSIDWGRLLHSLTSTDWDSSRVVFVRNLSYIKDLPSLIQANVRTVANYLFLKFIYQMSSEFQQIQYHQSFCFKSTNLYFQPIVTAMYLNSSYHQKDVEKDVSSMAHYFKDAFWDLIESNSWLDEDIKDLMLQRLKEIKLVIGDTDKSLNLALLERIYENLDIQPENDYYTNKMLLTQFFLENQMFYIKIVKCYFYSTDVSAFFTYNNVVTLPAGILRKPFFNPDLPASYNFGSLGAKIIGHEMSHAIKSYVNFGFMSSESSKTFVQRTNCFIEQYKSYRIPELNINIDGEVSLNENTADSEGLKAGFLAYKKWLEDNEGLAEEQLPGLNLTNFQLFFLSYAQSFCGQFKLKKSREMAVSDHTLNKWRIIGSISNFDEFGRQFKCKPGMEMNPIKKCELFV